MKTMKEKKNSKRYLLRKILKKKRKRVKENKNILRKLENTLSFKLAENSLKILKSLVKKK